MRAIKRRVYVLLGLMQATKQSALGYYLMQRSSMQATKQLADDAFGAVFAQPGWVKKCMQYNHCSKLEPNTP